MVKIKGYRIFGWVVLIASFAACKVPQVAERNLGRNMPSSFQSTYKTDSSNTAQLIWNEYFTDSNLNALIDTALLNNQELNMQLLELEIARNEIQAKKGEYLPFAGLKGNTGVEKVPHYTSQGANDANTEIKPGKEMPDPLGDFSLGVYASWEVDIWNKLHNAKKSTVAKYLATVEGKNFMLTHIVAEIANSYYELLALDNQLSILTKNIEIQSNALTIVKLQKEAARVTELAVKRFEAQVFQTKGVQFDIEQKIVETQNRINFLVGRYPQEIKRSSIEFNGLKPNTLLAGIPSQLLQNRPDIKQAEFDLVAAKLNVKVAKANFYPNVSISASLGLRAFNPVYLAKMPESLLSSLVGDLAAPLVNRNAIKTFYYNANAKQVQAAYNYELTILNAYMEVANQLSNIYNLEKKYLLKTKQVEALNLSVKISNELFVSARADYMEVLLTQRDALESKFELVETKKMQMNAMVNIYKALGGGWR